MDKRTKPVLQDIARTLGVSKMTVSRVLRGASGFPKASRDKGLTKVARTGYLPNRLAAGRKRVGCVGALGNRNTPGHLRYQGFIKGLADLGLTQHAEEILMNQRGFYGTKTMMPRQGNLGAIYFHDDEMAIGGLAYLTRIGLRVPDDIGIAGWGGMEAASILHRRLTATAIPTTKLGKVAARALVSRLRGDPVHNVTILPTRLVPGSTL